MAKEKAVLNALSETLAALRVLTLSEPTREWLVVNDGMALKQAEEAIAKAEPVCADLRKEKETDLKCMNCGTVDPSEFTEHTDMCEACFMRLA